MEELSCPWSGFEPATIKYCENILCDWITQPANTYSNLGFVFVGLYLILKREKDHSLALRMIGPLAVAVGATSFMYHASFTFFWQFFDLSSMFAFSSLMLMMNLNRLGILTKKTQVSFFTASMLLSVVLMYFLKGISGMTIFGLQLVAVFVTEMLLAKPNYRAIQRKFLYLAITIFVVSFAIWLLDTTRTVCNPDNHFIQGHAIWHVLNAFTFLFLYKFYHQFESEV